MTLFEVIWSRQALRDLDSLDATVQMRVILRVRQSQADPFRFFSRLKGERAFKLRVGDWRVVADISLGERKMVVVAVGHRKNVYD